MKRLLLVVLAVGALILVVRSIAGRETAVELPQGVQTVTGTLHRVEFSRTRRGTHVIMQGDRRFSLAESATVNLRNYEGEQVTMKGEFQANTDPSLLPVLVVTEVVSQGDAVARRSLPELKMELEAPVHWILREESREYAFALSGGTVELLRAFQVPPEPPPAGSSLIVAQRQAVRVSDAATGHQTIYVPLGDRLIVLEFTPPEGPIRASLDEQFSRLLRTVTIERASSAPTTGSGSGLPCGGPNGVLCPSGFYCAVEDTVENIGKCSLIGQ